MLRPHGEVIEVYRAATTGEDRYGDDVLGFALASTVAGVGFEPGNSNELAVRRDGMTIEATLYLAPGSDVVYQDRVSVRGDMWDVVTEPEVWTNLLTGWDAGVVVGLSRTEG